MTTYDATDVQDRIISEVGGDTPTNVLSMNIVAWWDSHADAGLLGGPLQYLLTKKDALMALALYWAKKATTVVGDIQVNYSDISKAMLGMAKALQTDIDREIERITAEGGVVSGVLDTTAPIDAPAGFPFDGNSGAYSGTPYSPNWAGIGRW
jgi:hypothetical protein